MLFFLKIFYKNCSGIIPDFFSNNIMEIITKIDPVFLAGNTARHAMTSLTDLISMKLKLGHDQDQDVWSIFLIRRTQSCGPENNFIEINCFSDLSCTNGQQLYSCNKNSIRTSQPRCYTKCLWKKYQNKSVIPRTFTPIIIMPFHFLVS